MFGFVLNWPLRTEVGVQIDCRTRVNNKLYNIIIDDLSTLSFLYFLHISWWGVNWNNHKPKQNSPIPQTLKVLAYNILIHYPFYQVFPEFPFNSYSFFSDLMQNPLIVPVKVLKGHKVERNLGVLDCCFHPHQPWVFSSAADKTIRLFTWKLIDCHSNKLISFVPNCLVLHGVN